MSVDRVQLITELSWPFRDQNGGPVVNPKTDLGWTSNIAVDPFPCYPHDLEIVRATLELVTAAFPLPEPFAPMVFVLSHEVLSRTNGHANLDFDYDWEAPADDPKDEGHQRAWRGYIVLSGKRIPPHPGMTRYLVAHEYGHVVEDWLIRQRRERAQSRHLLEEYSKLRGHAAGDNGGAGGGHWHETIQEIFANDFRLLRTGLEPDYWPHAGVERPGELEAIVDFWAKAH